MAQRLPHGPDATIAIIKIIVIDDLRLQHISLRLLHRPTASSHPTTDGHQLQILAYDHIKPRQPPNHKEFLSRIEKLYSTRQFLIGAFGDDLESVIVVGIDPGEVPSEIGNSIGRGDTQQLVLAMLSTRPFGHGFPTWTSSPLSRLSTTQRILSPSMNYDDSSDALTAAHKK
ncbi:hypothetical protein EC957_009784 [Mortierella hygrophila]|uniref:Uncharacterized protein n=1 Tax=Mortierella hygrophila TaxID=979708 RepID=A0A9P6FBT7_9FUNG|nr:hypothetical protein EC957_009784 [Mortierella hygrophila]